MPMFPDSGVPPSDAKNSLPDVNTAQPADELWYSTSRCQPRFDPAAANAMLAENMNLIMKGELQYDSVTLTHLERAVRYIDQRGLTTGTVLQGGPFDYLAFMDPPLTRYNDFLTLVVVPWANNQGGVRINVDNHGYVPLLRNDGQQLQFGDLRTGVPTIISYWAGNWYHVGLCSSQVPIVAIGAVDIWIRTDGNDTTGDGGANDPARAFRTIAGAWRRVGSRYAATPLFTMNFRLGIPGTYEGAVMGPFGGNVTLNGDPANRTQYRLQSFHFGNNIYGNLWSSNVNLSVNGITFVRDTPQGGGSHNTVLIDKGSCFFIDCEWDSTQANTGSTFICLRTAGTGGTARGDYTFNGRGLAIGSLVRSEGGFWYGCVDGNGAIFRVNDCAFSTGGYHADNLGVINSNSLTEAPTNVAGPKWQVTNNSILNLNGDAGFGSTVGITASGGQVNP